MLWLVPCLGEGRRFFGPFFSLILKLLNVNFIF